MPSRDTNRTTARHERDGKIIAALIAHPGQSRGDLAQELFISERQLQSDLRRVRGQRVRVVATVKVTRHCGYRLEIDTVESVMEQIDMPMQPDLPPHHHAATCLHLGGRYSPVAIGRWQARDGCTGDLCVTCFKSLNQYEAWRSRGILKCWYIPEGEGSAVYFEDREDDDDAPHQED